MLFCQTFGLLLTTIQGPQINVYKENSLSIADNLEGNPTEQAHSLDTFHLNSSFEWFPEICKEILMMNGVDFKLIKIHQRI
jgi:hypothetical protein